MKPAVHSGADLISNENTVLLSFLARFEKRGFAEAARLAGINNENTEKAARLEMPEAYRLDNLRGDGRGDRFCHADYLGRKTMSVDDYLAYYCGRRPEPAGLPAAVPQKSAVASGTCGAVADAKRKGRLKRAAENARETVMVWKKNDARQESANSRHNRLPVSTIASFFVIALCLMMIISASVMVADTQYEVSELKSEVSELKIQAEALEDKLESNIDYLAVYRTATEEYGMLDTAYVSSACLENEKGNTVEVFEEEETVHFGLGTLLSTIGIDIGSR